MGRGSKEKSANKRKRAQELAAALLQKRKTKNAPAPKSKFVPPRKKQKSNAKKTSAPPTPPSRNSPRLRKKNTTTVATSSTANTENTTEGTRKRTREIRDKDVASQLAAVVEPNNATNDDGGDLSVDEDDENAAKDDDDEDDDDEDEDDDDDVDEDDDAGNRNDDAAADGSASDDDDDDASDDDGSIGGSANETEIRPVLKAADAVQTRVRIQKNGEDKYWMTRTRQMVANCAPSASKKFVLYLPQTPQNSGSKVLIEADLNLQEYAVSRGGADKYSNSKAKFFNYHHRKAKTQLNRSIVMGFSKEDGEFQLVHNVMNGRDGPMKLHDHIGHIESVEALRNILKSDKLYTDPVLHKYWVGLFASNLVYGSRKADIKDSLDDIIDINYEAHARFEMYLRLSYQGYTHGYKKKDLQDKAAEFRQFRKLVRRDRLNNLAAAEEIRLRSVLEADVTASRAQALESGGLADTTDDEDDQF
jgi:hypothetical protein